MFSWKENLCGQLLFPSVHVCISEEALGRKIWLGDQMRRMGKESRGKNWIYFEKSRERISGEERGGVF